MVSTLIERGLQEFNALFDVITTSVPGTNEIADFNLSSFRPPLKCNESKVLIDTKNGIPMPFIIPKGHVLEGKSFFGNTNTSYTIRGWIESISGTNIYTLFTTIPVSSRGSPFNLILDMSSFTSAAFDPTGENEHKLIFTITNDDPMVELIGDVSFLVVIKRVNI